MKKQLPSSKKRTLSSQRWLARQVRDPYVLRAQKEGYRSRAVYKLFELNDKFSFLKPGQRVLDLGAAPGGWTQGCVSLVQSGSKNPKVYAYDLLPMDPLTGAIIIEDDFLSDGADRRLTDLLGEKVDVVLSDMAPATTGHKETDHLRILGLAETAYDFARHQLTNEGTFVAKIFQGGTERNLLDRLKKDFRRVHHAKPQASRKESSELYVVALGYRRDNVETKREEKT